VARNLAWQRADRKFIRAVLATPYDAPSRHHLNPQADHMQIATSGLPSDSSLVLISNIF
jgi:hypothetical protein